LPVEDILAIAGFWSCVTKGRDREEIWPVWSNSRTRWGREMCRPICPDRATPSSARRCRKQGEGGEGRPRHRTTGYDLAPRVDRRSPIPAAPPRQRGDPL